MNPSHRSANGLVLFVFAVIFVALTVSSYTQKSATVDEPQHLTAGYVALKLGDYRVDTEHPPFLRMWAALPLLGMRNVHCDTNSAYWLPIKPAPYSHEFLYEKNDADRLLYPARFMIVLLGLLLGAILFLWAQRLYGFWPAVVVLGLYTTEPNLLAHAGLVTTDFGLTCFLFVALYFLWRSMERLTLKTLALFIVFFVLAQISKFSALVLWPMVFVLLSIRVLRNQSWACCLGFVGECRSRTDRALVAGCLFAVLVLVSYAGLWAAYDFRYAPAPEGSRLERLLAVSSMAERVPRLAKWVNWIDNHHLLPNAYTQGFLLGRALAQQRPAYLLGRISDTGWWYYFPVAFLMKTPAALLLLFFGGLALMMRRNGPGQNAVFLLVPVAGYLCVAMMTVNLNIGVRHILPIYPFVLLIAGKAVAGLWQSRRKILRAALLLLCLFQAEETAFVYPHYLAFFNQLVGGPQNGYRYLADSNLDWGQDLKLLKQWMDKNGVQTINLSYFGHADPAYYGIHGFYLVPIPPFAEGRERGPRLPGYVAVSVQNLLGLSFLPVRRIFTGSCWTPSPSQ